MPAMRYETPGGVRELQVDSSEIEYNDETQHWRVKRGEKNGRDVYLHRSDQTRWILCGLGQRAREY